MKNAKIFLDLTACGLLLAFFLFFVVGCGQQESQRQAQQPQIRNSQMLNAEGKYETSVKDAEYGIGSKGFIAMPKKDGKYPGIVMVHEFWGLNDHIKEMARQLAGEGYVVLAVDLYEGKIGKNQTEARELSSKVRGSIPKAVDNMKAAVQHLKNLENVDGRKIASMGWCFGGQMSLQLALNEKLAATVIYYGSLETNATKLSFIGWPVLGIFGGKDTSIPVETVKKFESALNELGIENEINIYPNVGHAFANPSGMNYAPEETKDAWKKTLAFIEKHLKNED